MSDTTPRIASIAELAAELDKAITEHTQADEASIAAYHAKDDRAHEQAEAEMSRFDKQEILLMKAISRGRATNRDEAIMQAIVAMEWTLRVSEGQQRKYARHALRGLASAISTLAPDMAAVPPNIKRRYFGVWAKRLLGDAA